MATEQIRRLAPTGTDINPDNALLTSCNDDLDTAVPDGPPWSVRASAPIPTSGDLTETISRVEDLTKSGYQPLPTNDVLSGHPGELVYENENGARVGILACEVGDNITYHVFASLPCTIDQR
ncbi:hypothetical protein DFR67_103473 [Williamsia limnetica]|uniref:Uncharacterized protein n=1 Tax=Williamsia limnetica TaxID=882452 RepID=A0A318RS85_WILLI|nr:hypothetical protein DFR67_103473 [Williamsia limnetica]